jgi:predicted NAD/FAD-dependent oxidoreductase
MSPTPRAPQHFAIIGAGMAGITCARTLVQAGHHVTVFEKSRAVGGRMATRESAFGSFDHGAQYFTARDPRFLLALNTTPAISKRWSANSVQILDELGHVTAPGLNNHDAHWVAVPGMNALVTAWSAPLKGNDCIEMQTRVVRIERDALKSRQWQLRTESLDGTQHVFSGFDGVLLAMPAAQGHSLLQTSELAPVWVKGMAQVKVAPCWTLMLAFPNAMQPGLSALGPQWNAARSTHHRIAWLARESSKPGREPIERWTVQASAAWSQEHIHDDDQRAQAKLLKAFAEVTGIRAEPSHVDSQRWLYAKTLQPLGKSHLWDGKKGLGVCGDWCLGHRVEDAFVSGLELALSAI